MGRLDPSLRRNRARSLSGLVSAQFGYCWDPTRFV